MPTKLPDDFTITDHMDLRRLDSAILMIIARYLHYFENMNVVNDLETGSEVTQAIEGGLGRYNTDIMYRARVDMLTSAIMQEIINHNAN